MIYFDYSANTPVDNAVLDTFVNATQKYTANPNSNHYLGKFAKEQIDNTSSFIANYFNCNSNGIIYTSSATESNNLVIKGIADRYKNQGKHIIISAMEHSSIVAPCNYLSSLGYNISVLSTNSAGIVDLDELKNTINDKTILVSVCSVDSELGVIQPINEIANIVKNYDNCFFHTDSTQAIGKINVDFSNVDFVTFAPHKFYGLNGLGVLVNRSNIPITPLIHGGKSTTIYRSGSPDIASIMALDKAFKLALNSLNDRYSYVLNLNNILRNELLKYDCIHINSPVDASPFVLNFSLLNSDANTIIKDLNNNEIYVSNGTACSLDNILSKSVYSLTNDENIAKNTIRISLSYLNTENEIFEFIRVLHKYIS